MKYIKPLDGLRAIAVSLVIVWHWIPKTHFITKLHAGGLGVNIFFVLSGFLITQILLDNRNKAESNHLPKKNVLKNFYVRRVLRIFPIYYLTILAMIALNHLLKLNITEGELISSATYTSNFYWYLTKTWPLASPHFWSLAVEEQFYLIWPLLMLFFPRKYLLWCIVTFILIGFVSQLLITDFEFGYLPTYTCFDCFGVGGLLAYIIVFEKRLLLKFYRLLSLLSAIGLVLLFVDWHFYEISFMRLIHAILTAWLIAHILINNKSLLTRLLSNDQLVSLGKVSYGIYLYHVLYMYIALKIWYRYVPHFIAVIDKKYQAWLFLTVNYVVLYFICVLSWKLIEKPILSLKRKFEYQEN